MTRRNLFKNLGLAAIGVILPIPRFAEAEILPSPQVQVSSFDHQAWFARDLEQFQRRIMKHLDEICLKQIQEGNTSQ